MDAAASTAAAAPQTVRFPARDGFELVGDLWSPPNPTTACLVSAGTGFPRRHYARFAQMGAARGAAVLTFDYRTIGDSLSGPMNDVAMDYPDWGRLDMPAALDVLADAAPGVPLVHMGHSVGGHFVGFMDNQARIARHAFVCVGSGHGARHMWRQKPVNALFWRLYGPLMLAARGHIPKGAVWSGEALHRKVYTTWRRWCLTPGYFKRELEGPLRPHHFAEVTAPIRSYIYTDDPIATIRAGGDILALYENAEAHMAVRKPREDFGLKAVGHAGPFRKAALKAAGEIWRWLEGAVDDPGEGRVQRA